MQTLLAELNAKHPAIDTSALISTDGLVLNSAPHALDNEDLLAGLSAALYSVAAASHPKLNGGQFDHLLLQGSNGQILIAPVNDELLLTVVANTPATLNDLIAQAKQTCAQIGQKLAAASVAV